MVNFTLLMRRSLMDKESAAASVMPLPAPTIEKLPDASLLLNSPVLPCSTSGSSDHYSRVAAAVATNASRKREGNGSTNASTRAKVPRGSNIPHSKNIPDTSGGHLVPPQLRGRCINIFVLFIQIDILLILPGVFFFLS